jgi:hypothetical protein
MKRIFGFDKTPAELYPLFAVMGLGFGVCGYHSAALLFKSPDVTWNKGKSDVFLARDGEQTSEAYRAKKYLGNSMATWDEKVFGKKYVNYPKIN